MKPDNGPSPLEALSPRECQIMDAKCMGLQRAEIAVTLGISPRTYDHYMQLARAKGQCATVDELVSKYTAWKVREQGRG